MASATNTQVGRSVGHEWAVSVATSGQFCWPPTGSSDWPLTLDVRCLRRWHNEVAHWAWALCGGPVYIVARTVVLRRHGRFGSAPLWVVLGNVVASFVPFLGRAALYFWVVTMVIYSAVSPS